MKKTKVLFFLVKIISYLSILSLSSQLFAANFIGQMVWVKGSIKATNTEHVERVLTRQSPVYEGDTITTDKTGSGQIVFTDSSLLALRPDSEIVINQYYFKKDESPKSHFLLNLIKGGFRTITGIIAHTHPENYNIKTPVATIGVRGTILDVSFCTIISALCPVIGETTEIIKGKSYMETNAGRVELDANSTNISAHTTSPDAKPTVAPKSPPGTFSNQPNIVNAPAPSASGGSGTSGQPPTSTNNPSTSNNSSTSSADQNKTTTNSTDSSTSSDASGEAPNQTSGGGSTSGSSSSSSSNTSPNATPTKQPAICIISN